MVSENGIAIWDLDSENIINLIKQNNVVVATHSIET